MAERKSIEATLERLAADWEAFLEWLPSWLSGPLDWLVQLSLRDVWHGTVWLWNWWVDAPLWISLPLALVAVYVVAWSVLILGLAILAADGGKH
jgi:hypothetical protein